MVLPVIERPAHPGKAASSATVIGGSRLLISALNRLIAVGSWVWTTICVSIASLFPPDCTTRIEMSPASTPRIETTTRTSISVNPL